MTNKYIATAVAVCAGGAMAFISGPKGPGSGGLILWPLFGAINQLLAGLAFLVIAFYLLRHNKPVWFLVPPLVLMIGLPAWALIHDVFVKWLPQGKWHLVTMALVIQALQVWMVVEGALLWKRVKGVLPEALPPLPAAVSEGGRAC